MPVSVNADPVEGYPSLIQREGRFFDMGGPHRQLVPETLSPNANGDLLELLARDGDLRGHTIMLRRPLSPDQALPWLPDQIDQRFAGSSGPDLRVYSDGLVPHWGSDNTAERGELLLVPADGASHLYIRCGYTTIPGRTPLSCEAVQRYEPDPRLQVSVWAMMNGAGRNLPALAKRANELFMCLDVTEDVLAGTWLPADSQEGWHEDLAGRGCATLVMM